MTRMLLYIELNRGEITRLRMIRGSRKQEKRAYISWGHWKGRRRKHKRTVRPMERDTMRCGVKGEIEGKLS